MRRPGVVSRASAVTAVTVIRSPRAGVVSVAAILKASATTTTHWVDVNVPSVAVTTERYVPRGTNAPSSLRPFHVNVLVPAACGAPVWIVRTTAPDAFWIVQSTV